MNNHADVLIHGCQRTPLDESKSYVRENNHITLHSIIPRIHGYVNCIGNIKVMSVRSSVFLSVNEKFYSDFKYDIIKGLF